MNHEANIGLINPHPKSIGGDDELGAIGDEIVLDLRPFILGEGTVIGLDRLSGELEGGKFGGQSCGLSPGGGINNTGLIGMFLKKSDELEIFGGKIGTRDDMQEKIVASEAFLKDLGLVEVEKMDNIFGASRSSGSGESGDGWAEGQLLNEVFDLEETGAKIVTPETDAMGFVDGEEGN